MKAQSLQTRTPEPNACNDHTCISVKPLLHEYRSVYTHSHTYNTHMHTRSATPPTHSPWSKELDQDDWITSDRIVKCLRSQVNYVTLRSFFIFSIARGQQAPQHYKSTQHHCTAYTYTYTMWRGRGQAIFYLKRTVVLNNAHPIVSYRVVSDQGVV